MTTWLISGFFIFLLIAAGIHYKSKCRKEISAINAELENLSKWLEKPRDYKDIDASFNNHKRLNPAWKNFKESLTAKKYSTTDAAEFFNVTNLTRGINMTFWQGYGGIFTGLGILGTFAGLTVGLGGVVIPKDNNIEVLRDSIAQLLSGVETAFVTSLVGIFFALVYSWVHHNLLTKFQGNVQKLADNLDGQFKRRSAEDWLAENNATAQVQSKTLQSIDGHISAGNSLLEKSHNEAQAQSATLQSIDGHISAGNSLLEKSHNEAQAQSATLQSIDGHISAGNSLLEKSHGEAQAQTTALQNIGTDISSQKAILQNIGEDVARAIYDGLDERMNAAVETLCDKLEEKLMPQVDRICAAIDKLGTGGSEAIGDIFAGKVGSQMDRFSAALDKFSDGIDKKLDSANEISKIMNEQLLNTLKDLDESLKQHAEDSAKERAEAFEQFVLTLVDLSSSMNKVVEKLKVQQEDTAKNFAMLLKTSLDNFSATMTQILAKAQSDADKANDNTQAASNQFLATLGGLNKTFEDLAEKNKAQHENTAKDFAMLLKASLDNFSAVMEKILAKAQTDADKANDKTQAASNQFLTTLGGLNKTFEDLAGKIKDQQESTAKDFAMLLKTSLDNFSAVMEKIFAKAQTDADKVNDTNQKASEQFLAALTALNQTLANLAVKIKAQQESSMGNFNSLIKNLIRQLEEFTKQQKDILNNSAHNHAAQISEAVKAFRDIVDNHNATIKKTFGEVQTLLNETETFLYSIDTASNTLKQAATPVKESTLQLSRNLTETSAQMKTLATANQTTRDNLAALSTRLADFVTKFNGIADELERATDIIRRSLDNYNVKTSKELSDALTKFGNKMADALGGLDEAVSDFSEAVGHVKKNRR